MKKYMLLALTVLTLGISSGVYAYNSVGIILYTYDKAGKLVFGVHSTYDNRYKDFIAADFGGRLYNNPKNDDELYSWAAKIFNQRTLYCFANKFYSEKDNIKNKTRIMEKELKELNCMPWRELYSATTLIRNNARNFANNIIKNRLMTYPVFIKNTIFNEKDKDVTKLNRSLNGRQTLFFLYIPACCFLSEKKLANKFSYLSKKFNLQEHGLRPARVYWIYPFEAKANDGKFFVKHACSLDGAHTNEAYIRVRKSFYLNVLKNSFVPHVLTTNEKFYRPVGSGMYKKKFSTYRLPKYTPQINYNLNVNNYAPVNVVQNQNFANDDLELIINLLEKECLKAFLNNDEQSFNLLLPKIKQLRSLSVK
jgi:hypothetical protein